MDYELGEWVLSSVGNENLSTVEPEGGGSIFVDMVVQGGAVSVTKRQKNRFKSLNRKTIYCRK